MTANDRPRRRRLRDVQDLVIVSLAGHDPAEFSNRHVDALDRIQIVVLPDGEHTDAGGKPPVDRLGGEFPKIPRRPSAITVVPRLQLTHALTGMKQRMLKATRTRQSSAHLLVY